MYGAKRLQGMKTRKIIPGVTCMKQVHPPSDEVQLQKNWLSCFSHSKDSYLVLLRVSSQKYYQMSLTMLAENGFLPSFLGSLH